MAPRPKRTRTSLLSAAIEEFDAAIQEDATSRIKPHETLWHKDGNIVLASDAIMYRVHKGVLANQSTVFRDMFELPNTEEGGSERRCVDIGNGELGRRTFGEDGGRQGSRRV